MGCFRPLAGMNCNPAPIRSSSRPMSFRPLAGMNCNVVDVLESRDGWSFPSPRGDELQPCDCSEAGSEARQFPSPRGDELQRNEP